MIHICNLDDYHVVLDSINGKPVHYYVSRLNGSINVDLNELALGMGFNGVADMSRCAPGRMEALARSIGFQDSTEILMKTPGLMDEYLDSLNQGGFPQPGMLALTGDTFSSKRPG